MIPLVVNDIWKSIQEGEGYYIVIVGPTFVRIKSVDNPDLVVTIDHGRLYEWFSRTGETYEEDCQEEPVEVV